MELLLAQRDRRIFFSPDAKAAEPLVARIIQRIGKSQRNVIYSIDVSVEGFAAKGARRREEGVGGDDGPKRVSRREINASLKTGF